MLSPSVVAFHPSISTVNRLLSLPSASGGLASILFEIEGPGTLVGGANYLWPGDETSENTGFGFFSLYEYRGTENIMPELVGVDNEKHLISQCGTSLGFPRQGAFTFSEAEESDNAISSDGSHVFFTAAGANEGPEKNACTETGWGRGPEADELYVRINGSDTIPVSEPSLDTPNRECTGLCREDENQENGHKRSAGVFRGASEDGSKVFFLSSQPLVNGDEDSTPDLYEAEVGGGSGAGSVIGLVQVSHAPNMGEAADVQGVARVSGDGSHVYFVARGVLTNKIGPEGDGARSGADNLYVYDTETKQTAFIGDLCSRAETSGVVIDLLCPKDLNNEPPEAGGMNDLGDWQRKDERPVDVNACGSAENECEAGRFLVFTSDADLTPGDTNGVAQVFEYDAKTATLVRVSVGQNGFDDNGNAGNEPASIAYPNYTENHNPARQLTSVSDNGSHVVFQSSDALTPAAAGGYPNVYEYYEGQISPISDGEDRTSRIGGVPSTSLLGMDESGNDIFFMTADQLVPQDGDTQVDIYDARIDGGFPPSAILPSCAGDGCQGAFALAPVPPTVGSVKQSAGEDINEISTRLPAKLNPHKTKARKRARAKSRKARVETRARHRVRGAPHKTKNVPLAWRSGRQ